MKQPDMDEQEPPENRFIPWLNFAITLALLLLIFFELYPTRKVVDYSVDSLVVAFLDEYVAELSEQTGDTHTLEKYIESKSLHDGNEIESADFAAFYNTFTTLSPDIHSYKITRTNKDYVELVLLNSKSEAIFPRIGFWYKTNDIKTAEQGGKITGYTICRLLPFSRYDAEFVKEWS